MSPLSSAGKVIFSEGSFPIEAHFIITFLLFDVEAVFHIVAFVTTDLGSFQVRASCHPQVSVSLTGSFLIETQSHTFPDGKAGFLFRGLVSVSILSQGEFSKSSPSSFLLTQWVAYI